MSGWQVTIVDSDDDGTPRPTERHVAPLEDLRPHAYSLACWCHPTPDDDEPSVVVHHACDRRESYETGELKPN